MNEKSTLAHMMPKVMKMMRAIGYMPMGLIRPVAPLLSQKTRINLPALKANAAYFKIMQEGFDGKRKTVVHPFNFPPEILHAMDLAPVYIELISTSLRMQYKRPVV